MKINSLLTCIAVCMALSGLSAQRCDFTGTPMSLLQAPGSTTGRDALPVPVVFHILYRGAADSISDNQILSQLEILNADYNASNADLALADTSWQRLAGSTNMHFCLYAAGGIRRKQVPAEPAPGFSVFYSQQGGDDAVLPEKVLNIWVTMLKRPLLGYANPPHQYPPEELGVVVDYRCLGALGAAVFNQPFHLGRTLTHEIGHFFGLLHVWGNWEEECLEDDGIADTPPQYTALYNCPGPVQGCNADANVGNFMNLTDDACMYMFTRGQATYMRQFIGSVLPEMGQEDVCSTEPTTYMPVSDATLTVYPNPNYGHFVVENRSGQAGRLLVWSVNGQLVVDQPAMEPVTLVEQSGGLAPGYYRVRLETEVGTWEQAVIVLK